MNYWQGKRAVVTGGSAGLGRAVADVLVDGGARVAIVARRQPLLEAAAGELRARGGSALPVVADLTRPEDVSRLACEIRAAWGGVDLLCHCAGRSMRGSLLETPPDEFRALWETNYLSALLCTQQFAPALAASRGHLVLIGSLASKAAAAYLGAYPASKFALAALAQQLRLEVGPSLHVLLVCPGPIARSDGREPSARYAQQAADLPEAARRPGAGAKLRAIDPHWLARRILRACESRQAELVVPRRARLLFALSQLAPRAGDWLLRKMTT
jgi:NAD(P)-dependent dehydrogenase (short-subunit alcohol dehydrogenase family)